MPSSQTIFKASLELDDDADRSKHRGCKPQQCRKQALARPAGVGEHQTDPF